ncbi:hypothetical protein LJR231_000649 [Phyllobacterium sp. LjRoot231]|uniref:DUF7507 domain-containing protein n=1 Tax=Phyllobacterium sp. LjRoot231 TaxID=3342289 RepID=UPI003ED0C6C3
MKNHRAAFLSICLSLAMLLLASAPTLAAKLVFTNISAATDVPQTGTGQGKRALYSNAGTVGGVSVDLVAKLVKATTNPNFSSSGARISISSAGQDTIWIDWYIYKAGTYNLATDSGGVAVSAEVMVQFADIDGPNNERLFIPLCAPPVEFARISRKSTLTRDFGTVAGVPEVFSDIGDKNYDSQPESGAEMSYSTTSVFKMGRTANNGFFIKLDNPSYAEADSFDLKCSDFRAPAAVDDIQQADIGMPAVVQILNNDGVKSSGGVFSVVSPATGFSMASVNLAAPSGATGIIKDANGDVTGFTVAGQGVWSYDDLTGTLTFTPQTGYRDSPTPIQYTFKNAIGTLSNLATVTVTYPQLEIIKTATPPATFSVGAAITYAFKVTNPGVLTVSGITVTDILPNIVITGGPITLAGKASDTTTFTASYKLTQADLNAGQVVNTATATGKTPQGNPLESLPSTVTTIIPKVPSLAIVKTAGKPSGNVVGATIPYTFTVTNTGTLTMVNVTVIDSLPGITVRGGPIMLAPGASDTATFTAVYTLMQKDIDTGEVENSATAKGNPPIGPPFVSPPSVATTPIISAPGLTVLKTAGTPSGSVAGATIPYRFTVSSTTGTDQPVRDGALGGNKVYLISQYEFTPVAGTLDGYVYGGRVQHWFADKLRIGVTGMDENTGLANQQAYGADIQLRHSETTFIEAEVARSKGPGFSTSRSTDGGLTLSDVSTTGTRNRVASSWRTKGQLDLEDISKSGIKGTVGGYYEQKQAGFSTLADQISVDERIFGAFANIEVTKAVSVELNYDDYKQGRGTSDFDGRDIGERSRRRGASAISWQLNEHWKASFGLTYTDLQSPIARTSGKSGYNGSRLDSGARLEYAPDDDHTYYIFGQGTISRSGDIDRNDRIGVGTDYQLTEKIELEGEISYGNQGFGALAAINYHPTAEDTYYVGYRLDPDRAFDLDRSYDLSGTDRGTIVVGAKRKLDDTLLAYAERNYDLFGTRNSLTETYGVVYTLDKSWTIDGGFEAGRIEDDTIDSDDGFERADFDRKAVSLAIGYKDEERISARIRGEARFENSDDDSRDANTYLIASGLSWKTSEDWRLLANIDAVLSDSDRETSFRDGNYVELSVGYAYRPIDNDRLNALFKYAWLRDTPGEDQVSAINGDEFGPSQRSHILSVDANYDLTPWLTIGGKYGFRHGETRQRPDDDRETFSAWETSSAHLGILRADVTFVKSWDALIEARVLSMAEADTTDYGALLALYRHVGDNFKVGVGYNFGCFSDDLRDLTLNDEGVFLNVIGKF